jgi:hypothetical protein
MLTFMEVSVGAAIVALLILVAITVFRVTEKGTIQQKKLLQSQNLAKEKVEEIKSYINSTNWESVRVDSRFPAGTPSPTPYANYPPVTIRVENSEYIVDPEVRYVREDVASQQIVPVNTPGTVETPEYSDMLRLRTDVYFGPKNEFVPVPTLEAAGPNYSRRNRVVVENIVSRKTAQAEGTGIVNGIVQLNNCGVGSPVPPTSAVEVAAYRGNQKLAFTQASTINGAFQFDALPEGPVSIAVASSQAVTWAGYCGTHPVTVDATTPRYVVIRVSPLPVRNITGYAFTLNPLWTPNPMSPSVTPVVTLVPATNVQVSVDDGISRPVNTGAGNFFLVPNVRSTPVPVPTWYTVSGQNTQFSGKGYYQQDGQPVTILLYDSVLTQAVTVLFHDVFGNNVPAAYFPVTCLVTHGGAPVTVAMPTYTNSFWVTVNAGPVTFRFTYKDPGPILAYLPYTGTGVVTMGQADHIYLYGIQPVGTGAGTIMGLGNFPYEQFRLVAEHVYDVADVPNIPVSHTAGATFGTFWFNSFPATIGAPWQYTLRLDTDQGTDYATDQPLISINQDMATTLVSQMYVRRKNAYVLVRVSKGGGPYPYGALVQCAEGAGVTVPDVLGAGSPAQRYFSTTTTGSGQSLFPVQLYSDPVTYAMKVRIVDPATLQMSVTEFSRAVSATHTYESPLTVTVNF